MKKYVLNDMGSRHYGDPALMENQSPASFHFRGLECVQRKGNVAALISIGSLTHQTFGCWVVMFGPIFDNAHENIP